MASNRGCGSCEAVCECRDYCYCCPNICDCICCYKLRKTRPLCEKCGHGASCHKTKILSMYPGVRIDKLPNLDFLNPKPASGATGHSSERNNQPQIPICNNSRCQDSENSSPDDDSLIFQMDDIDTSLPPVFFSVEVAPENAFELPETSYAKATKHSPSKSSQRDDYLPSNLSSKSVSRNSISPNYPNHPSKSEQPISENSGCFRQNSHLQLLTDKVSPETATLCSERNEIQKLGNSSEKIQHDRQEFSSSDFQHQERNTFIDSHSQLRTNKDSPEIEVPCNKSKEMQKVSNFEHSSEKIQADREESSKSDLPKE